MCDILISNLILMIREILHIDEFIKLLDSGLDYVNHEIIGDTIVIHVVSNREEVICPYCGCASSKKHSVYERSFQDLPVMGMKSRIILNNRKMFCTNPECSHTTFAETFSFIRPKAKKSNRLLDRIVDVSLNVSSLNVVGILKNGIADVAEWLSTFPNLEIVSRDGPVSYHSAIKQADGTIIQISDRFHLLKGLTDAAKTVITSLVAANTGIPMSVSHYEGTETTDYWEKDSIREDFPAREHNANCEKKKRAAEKVLELTKQGWKRTKIAEETGISYATVRRYQSPYFSPVHGRYNTNQDSKIKPYAEKIKQMIKEGKTFRQIEEAIKQDGYDGASSTIRMYTTRERKFMKEAKGDSGGNVEKIERKWLISLLYKPADKVKKISQEQLDKVIEKYPQTGEVYDVVKTFKNTLFSKKPDELEKWMDEAERLELEQICSFVNGLRRDIDAVKKQLDWIIIMGLRKEASIS